MSAIFIEKIKRWISTPIAEQSLGEELLGLIVIAGVMALIWLIGELIYRWEECRDE